MNRSVHLFRVLTCGATALLLGLASGCRSSGTSGNQKRPAAAAVAASVAATPSNNPGIDLQCAANHIRNAPGPFHWSYKKRVIGLSDADWEADVTAGFISGTFIDGSGVHAIHGALSDSTSWNSAVMILTGPLPASTFALVNNSSAVVRDGVENENGQEAIKYSIDTKRASGGETALIKSVLGANGFIKGVAWVTPQGCPVKFFLNVEQHNKDGTVEREHYEENITGR